MGLLTFRAAMTLRHYLSETNQHVYHWLSIYMQQNPIKGTGSWDEVSGEVFLRQLLSAPIDLAKWSISQDPMYDCVKGIHVDPKDIARRIMQIRAQLAKEWIEELQTIEEENLAIMRDGLVASFRVLDEEVTVAAGSSTDSDSEGGSKKDQ